MPSYQTTASKTGAGGKSELVASLEFEAIDTTDAKAKADACPEPRLSRRPALSR